MSQAEHSEQRAHPVIVECDLAEKPETVWRALTVPEIVAEWLGPNTLKPEVGEPFTVRLAPHEGGSIACEVLEAIPHERLTYSWRTTEPDTTGRTLDTVVTFELAGMPDGGTRLRIVHSDLPAIVPAPFAATMAMGRSLAQVSPSRHRQGRRAASRPGLIGRAPPPLAAALRRAA